MAHRILTRLLLLSLVSMPLVVLPSALAEEPAVQRVSGANRFATAAALATTAAGKHVDRVWLATGADFPDALAVAATGDPILLVEAGRLPVETRSALERLRPATVTAVGGQSVVDPETLAEAGRAAGSRIERVSGGDRYGTAAAVALRRERVDAVWLATGVDYADALAAGPVAAGEGAVLLLTAGRVLPTPTRQALETLRPDEIVIVGGQQTVPPEAAQEAAQAAGGAALIRLSGPTRFETAVAIAARGRAGLGYGDHVYLATAAGFADALAAGPAAAAHRAPLLLATHTTLPGPTRTALISSEPERVTLVGGSGVLSRTVEYRAARPEARGTCDLYDATDPRPIQGHPEGQRPSLDAYRGPWVVDDYRQTWGVAVPYRWRVDKIEDFEARGVLFYVDTESGYDHWFSVTVFCGNPFLVGGGRALDPSDPRGIAATGPHRGLGTPDQETFSGPALYTAVYREPDRVRRYDYVAVDDDVILFHFDATNRFAHEFDQRATHIADAVSGSVGRLDEVQCPPHASDCLRR